MRLRLSQLLACLFLFALWLPALDAAPARGQPDSAASAPPRPALPEEPDHERRFVAELGQGFSVYVTDHFLALYDTDEAWTRERAELLERAHDRFYETFEAVGYRLRPVQERLECVMFAKPDRFDVYAQRADRTDMSWSGGYYSTRTNRIAFFDERQPRTGLPGELRGRGAQWARADGDNRDHEHAGEAGEPSTEVAMRSPQTGGGGAPGGGDADGQRLAMLNASKTTHEAVHQLAFNSGLQKRGVMYPLWLAEGLATNFEPAALGEPFGPTCDNPNRRERLTAAADFRGLMPLRDLVAVTRLTSDPTEIGDTYAQAWGLFHFLFNDRPEAMRNYLEGLARLSPGRRDADTLRREFEVSFGSIDRVETAWRAFVHDLP